VTLDDRQACTLPIAGLTAWFGLVEHAGVRAGATVLIPGTGGGAHLGQSVELAAVGGRVCQIGAPGP